MTQTTAERWQKWREGLSDEDWEARKGQMREKAKAERLSHNPKYDKYVPKPKKFICWDGESDREGNYWLIQNSDGYELDAHDLGKKYLTIRDVLPEFTRRRDKSATNVQVLYAGNFDFNMLFAHESRELKKTIFQKDEPGIVDNYQVRVIPRKMMKIRPADWPKRHPAWPWKLYDAWGYFSATGSFVKTLDKWKIPHDPIIEEGKRLRENFPRDFDVKRYNMAEVLALKELMEKFYASLKILDDFPGVPKLSRIRSWHGAGTLADKTLSEFKAEDLKKGDFSWDRLELGEGDLMDAFPLDVWKAIWAGRDGDVVVGRGSLKGLLEKAGHVLDYKRKMAYFGGRIELLQRGEFDRIFNYDINSCYPRAITDLPDLSASKWKTWEDFKEEDLMSTDFGLCEVEWQGSPDDSIGPLPLRTDGKHNVAKGYVVFPAFNTKGKYFRGIYHVVEAKEAIKKNLWDVRLTGSAWTLDNEYPRPFEKIRELARIRLELKKTGNQAHEPLKLGLNSLYGKFAQKIMGDYEPKYRELVWAGYCTAYARSQLLKYSKPDDAVLFATDGIYSTSKLDVPIGEGLGEWDAEEGPGRFMIAGLYEFNGSLKHRGYPNIDFDRAFKIITLKAKNDRPEEEQNYHVTDRLFVGVKRSLAQSRRYPEVKFYENRQRLVNWNHNEKRTAWLADGDRWTSFPSQTSQVWSCPYDFRDFDDEEDERQSGYEEP